MCTLLCTPEFFERLVALMFKNKTKSRSKQKERTMYSYKNEVMVCRKMHQVNAIQRRRRPPPIQTKPRKWVFRRMNIMYDSIHPIYS